MHSGLVSDRQDTKVRKWLQLSSRTGTINTHTGHWRNMSNGQNERFFLILYCYLWLHIINRKCDFVSERGGFRRRPRMIEKTLVFIARSLVSVGFVLERT